MAERKYKRPLCSVASCGKPHKACGLCETHYRQLQRGTFGLSKERPCAQCGDVFTPFNRQGIYCTKACKMAAFAGKPKGQSRSLMLAQQAAAVLVREESAALVRIARKWRAKAVAPQRQYFRDARCECCGVWWTPMAKRERRVGAAHDAACLAKWEETLRERTRVGRRQYKRVWGRNHRSRAKARGAAYHPFKITEVFERDRWRCAMCGVATPKRLRGTCEANAPELDHIVPLAAGGGHTKENCQCACRACNLAKLDRPMGQTWLPGFA